MWIVKIALQRSYTFIVLAIMIVLLGGYAIAKTATDIFPNIKIPVAAVIWRYSGRYKAGLVTYLEVATTETIALQAQLSRVNILNRHMDASVLLVKALGGGWRIDTLGQTQSSAAAPAAPIVAAAR